MARTSTIGYLQRVLLPAQLGNLRQLCFLKPDTTNVLRCQRIVPASSSTTAFVQETKPMDDVHVVVQDEDSTGNSVIACPICYEPFCLISDGALTVDASATAPVLQCNTCKKAFPGKETHLDLTVSSGAKEYDDDMPLATELFRTPVVSYLYERGWRQNFFLGGFPGAEQEFELTKGYLEPVLGGNIVDASCASGLFSRLFAKSGLFSLVVALDYSETMLQQCYEFVKHEENCPKEKLIMVRADISRLPFVSGSVDAVHAGAALHCWPSPSAGVAEISRVLRPGGVFVASTFILDGPFSFVPFLRPLTQNFAQASGGHIFTSERELENLCTACGLVGFKCLRNRQFIMLSATKPNLVMDA